MKSKLIVGMVLQLSNDKLVYEKRATYYSTCGNTDYDEELSYELPFKGQIVTVSSVCDYSLSDYNEIVTCKTNDGNEHDICIGYIDQVLTSFGEICLREAISTLSLNSTCNNCNGEDGIVYLYGYVILNDKDYIEEETKITKNILFENIKILPDELYSYHTNTSGTHEINFKKTTINAFKEHVKTYSNESQQQWQ